MICRFGFRNVNKCSLKHYSKDILCLATMLCPKWQKLSCSQQHQEKLPFFDRTKTTAAATTTTTTTWALKVSDFTQVGFTVIPPQIFKQIQGRTTRPKIKTTKTLASQTDLQIELSDYDHKKLLINRLLP